MKWIFAVVAVISILSTGKAVPSSLEDLIDQVRNLNNNEASAQPFSVADILKDILAAEQNEITAKSASLCPPGPRPICTSFLGIDLCCKQPKVLCDVCRWLGYDGCCSLLSEEPETEEEVLTKVAMQNEEAKAAFVCPPGPLPYCESVQSPPICCKQDPTKCALCRVLGLSPCCPHLPPDIHIGK